MNSDRNDLILSVATEGFWDWDLIADQAYLSPRYCEMIGYSPEDTVFDRAFLKKLIHPDDHQRVFKVFEEYLQGTRDTSVVEHRMITRNGTVRWMEVRGRLVEYDASGRPSRMVGTVIDISDRKRSDESFHSLISNLPGVVVAHFDRNLRHRFVTNCIEEITGLPREFFIGKSNRELGMPDDLVQQWEDALHAVWETGLPQQIEYSYHSPKGQRFYESHLIPEQGADGSIATVISVSRDITDRKQMEEELRQSQTLLNNLSQQVPGALFQVLIRPDGHICTPYASEKLNDVYEVSPVQVSKGNSAIFDRFHPDDRDRILAGISAATEKLITWECEYRVNLPRQGLKWLYGIAQPQKLDDGTVAFYGIIMDITERKQVEETLSHSRNLLSSILDHSPYAFFVKDVSAQFRVILWNRAAEKIFGIPAADILGKNGHDLWPREQAEAFLADDRAVVASRVPADIPEETSNHPEKGTIYLHTRKIPLMDDNGNVSHIIVICDDITEHRMMLTELVKTQKLESLGILAGGIAHDFNNILTGITGNISFARTLFDESHKAAAALQNAEKAANRAADLAHQLLTFAKGGQPIKKAVSVRHVLEESATFVLRGSNVSCDIEMAENLLAVEADEGQISQVISNIIINASQAMPGGGTIVIRGENVTIDGANVMSLAPGAYIKLTFSDTGCGIPEQDQKKIFDPYFTSKPSGSGLGLASAHSIIFKHGGHISVRSVVGTGTTFEILLPASDWETARDDTGTAPVTLGSHTGISVLVMDDEELIRDMHALMMDELGYHVQTCANGEEAIALYKAALDVGAPYSAVIMDLTIPGGMGGREAAEHILAIDPHARLIVSSGYSTDPIMGEFVAFGFCATLQKPYSIEEITKTISSVLSTNPKNKLLFRSQRSS